MPNTSPHTFHPTHEESRWNIGTLELPLINKRQGLHVAAVVYTTRYIQTRHTSLTLGYLAAGRRPQQPRVCMILDSRSSSSGRDDRSSSFRKTIRPTECAVGDHGQRAELSEPATVNGARSYELPTGRHAARGAIEIPKRCSKFMGAS